MKPLEKLWRYEQFRPRHFLHTLMLAIQWSANNNQSFLTLVSISSVRSNPFPNSDFRIRKVEAKTLYDEFDAGYAGVMIGITCNRSRILTLGFHPWYHINQSNQVLVGNNARTEDSFATDEAKLKNFASVSRETKKDVASPKSQDSAGCPPGRSWSDLATSTSGIS